MSRDAFIELMSSFVHEVDEHVGLDSDEAAALLVRVRAALAPLRPRRPEAVGAVHALEAYLCLAHDKLLALDPASTGFVSYRDVERVLQNLQVEYDQTSLDRLLMKYDAFQRGRVNYTCFLKRSTAVHEATRPTAEELNEMDACRLENAIARLKVKLYEKKTSTRELYLRLNPNRFGYLTLQELDHGLATLGVRMPMSDLQYIVKECTKKDSMLSLVDFCKLVESLPEDFKLKALPTLAAQETQHVASNQAADDVQGEKSLSSCLRKIAASRGKSTRQFFEQLCHCSNSVSVAAIESVLGKVKRADVVKLVGLYDTTGSGTLDYHEFVHMLQS